MTKKNEKEKMPLTEAEMREVGAKHHKNLKGKMETSEVLRKANKAISDAKNNLKEKKMKKEKQTLKKKKVIVKPKIDTNRKPCECLCGGVPVGKRSKFLPGHDMVRRSALLKAARNGDFKAANELKQRGWPGSNGQKKKSDKKVTAPA